MIHKYRVWDKKNKKMLLPENQEFIIIPTSPSFGADTHYDSSNLNCDSESCFDWASADLISGRFELMQFTGQTDKNKTECYFGDIIKTDDGAIGVIEWDNKSLRVCFRWIEDSINGHITYPRFPYDCTDFIIIGNIHENPEMMEE